MLKLVTSPDRRLKMTCTPIEEFNENVRTFTANLARVMLKSGGIGISAPQLGFMKRIIIISDPRMGIVAMANPEITAFLGQEVPSLEACLSFPGKAAAVYRNDKIKVRYLSVDNEYLEVELDGQAAKVTQHEIDHLDGITMEDRNREARKKLKERQHVEIKSEATRQNDSSSQESVSG